MPVIKKIIREFTPPIFIKLSLFIKPEKDVKEEIRTIRKIEEMGPKTLSLCFGVPVFTIPVHKLRYYGGLPYDYEHHHFLKYYKYGKSALIDFYQSHQPENIFEKHFLPVPENNSNNQVEQIEKESLPWLFNINNIKFNGEKTLGKEHGDQAYGPVTDKKIELEANRLDKILHSIKKNGFNPLQYGGGYPKGYFLLDKNDKWTFLVRTGFHRVAALIHLGYSRIPFEFQKDYPRIINQSDSLEWILVKEGYLTRQEAEDIFMQYLN